MAYHKVFEFYGSAGAGAIEVPGVLKGDRIVGVFNDAACADQTSLFCNFITEDSYIYQTEAQDFSTVHYYLCVASDTAPPA